jgi:hypothetical protein
MKNAKLYIEVDQHEVVFVSGEGFIQHSGKGIVLINTDQP